LIWKSLGLLFIQTHLLICRMASPLLRFILFDKEKVHAEALRAAFAHGQYGDVEIEVVHSAVEQVLDPAWYIDALVSPANSFGYMDGGIDRVYCTLFGGLEDAVQKQISKHGQRSPLGRASLPIGKSVVVDIPHNAAANSSEIKQVGNSQCVNPRFLIVSPTMEYPGRIVGTDNVFMAFYSCVREARALSQQVYGGRRQLVVACPLMGAGVGEMDPTEAATQMLNAFLATMLKATSVSAVSSIAAALEPKKPSRLPPAHAVAKK